MLNCQEASRLASSRMDAPLTLTSRIALSMHLMMCRHCRRFARQIERLRRIAVVTHIDADVQLPDAARARLGNALRQQIRNRGTDDPEAV